MEINVTMSQEEFEKFLEFKRNESKEILQWRRENRELGAQLEDLAIAICNGLSLNESGEDWEITDNEEIFHVIKLANELLA